MTSQRGPSLPPAPVSFEERDGVPTWIVPGQNRSVVIDVEGGRVSVAGLGWFNEAQLRALIIALQAAWSRVAEA